MARGPDESEHSAVDDHSDYFSPEAIARRDLADALTPPDPELSLYAPQHWHMPPGVPPERFQTEIKYLTGVWRGGRQQDQLRRIARYLDDHPEFDLVDIRQVYVDGSGPGDRPERIMFGELGHPGRYPEPKPNPGPTPA